MITNVAKWSFPGLRLRLLSTSKSCTLSKIKTGRLVFSNSSTSLLQRTLSFVRVFCPWSSSFSFKNISNLYSSSISFLISSTFIRGSLLTLTTASIASQRLDRRHETSAWMVIKAEGLWLCLCDSFKLSATCLASSDLPEPGPPLKYTCISFPWWTWESLFISSTTKETSSSRFIQGCCGGRKTSLW